MAAPTYPLTMPTSPAVEMMDMGPGNSNLHNKAMTGKRKVGLQAYHLWNIDIALPKMERAEAGEWISFFTQLRGVVGTFKFPIPGTAVPISGYTGTVGIVKGASQTGYTLVTDGWDNEVDVLAVGDMFTVNDELVVVRTLATTSVIGEVTITFDPPLKSSPDDNAVITINNPYVVLHSLTDLPRWKVGHPVLMKTGLKCEESYSG